MTHDQPHPLNLNSALTPSQGAEVYLNLQYSSKAAL